MIKKSLPFLGFNAPMYAYSRTQKIFSNSI